MTRRQQRERLDREGEQAAGQPPENKRGRGRRLLTAGVGAAAALAVGAVAIRKARIRAGGGPRSVVRLEPDGEGWRISVAGRPDPHGRYQIKQAGLEEARSLARQLAPSELVIYRRDGREQDRHRYEPSTA